VTRRAGSVKPANTVASSPEFYCVRADPATVNSSFIVFLHDAGPTQSEAFVQIALSNPGLRRWWVPILLAVVVPLLFAALPGEPLQILATDAGPVKHVRTEVEVAPYVLSGRSAQISKLRFSGVRRAGMAAEASPESGNVAAMRDAVLTAGIAGAPSNAIDSVLGQLQASDETRLQEPWLAMRLAAMRSERDPRLAEQVSHWAAIFAARLDELVIPQGTRTNLLARLAAYERAVLSVRDALPRQQVDREAAQAAARTAEAALAAADRASTAK
jgi:hypothetical protein